MEAFILLLLSVFLVSVYGIGYVSLRLVKQVKKEEKRLFYRTFIVLLALCLLSGTSVTLLML